MAQGEQNSDDRRAGVPARISDTTHREMRYVSAMLSLREGEQVTIRSLVDLGWETLKKHRPDIVELLNRAEASVREKDSS